MTKATPPQFDPIPLDLTGGVERGESARDSVESVQTPNRSALALLSYPTEEAGWKASWKVRCFGEALGGGYLIGWISAAKYLAGVCCREQDLGHSRCWHTSFVRLFQ